MSPTASEPQQSPLAPNRGSTSTDDLLARVERATAQADETLLRARRHASLAAEQRGVGRYRGVEVVVDSNGLLRDVSVLSTRSAGTPQAWAQALLQAHAAAVRDLSEALRRTALQAWGDGDEGQRMASSATRRFLGAGGTL